MMGKEKLDTGEETKKNKEDGGSSQPPVAHILMLHPQPPSQMFLFGEGLLR